MTTFADTDTPLDITTPDYERDASNADRFVAFHRANPGVLVALEASVRRLVESGPAHFGIELAYAPLRYEAAVVTGEEPKLNNNHRAFYSRLIARRNPSWADRLTFRVCEADDLPDSWWADVMGVDACHHGEPIGRCASCAACDACDGKCGTCPYGGAA